MREAHEQHQATRTYKIPRIVTDPPPGGRTISRIYDQQNDFLRDLHRNERRGWKLVGARRQPAGISLEVIRASIPGALLHAPCDRVIAHYSCVSGHSQRALPLASMTGRLAYQSRLATSGWLERLAHAIQPPCLTE